MEHFVWSVEPAIFSIGMFEPRYYGLTFAIGFQDMALVGESVQKCASESV